jgi:glycosyltransferase involved in cell wall biosynthesis
MSGSAVVSAAKKSLRSIERPRSVGGAEATSVAIYMHDLSGGGVERQSLIIAEEFRRSGIDVTLVLHRLRGELAQDVPSGLRIVDLESNRTLGDVVALMGFLRRNKPDILLSNLDLNNIAALLSKGLSFSRSKIVICQHNPISESFVNCENWMYRQVPNSYRTLKPLISRAVAVSAGVAEELVSLAGLAPENVVTINNPVIGPEFLCRSQEGAEHRWFGPGQRPVFVTAGRLVTQKDHQTMLKALALHRQRHDSKLIMLGTGPLEAELRALAAELGINDSVDFAGFRPNALPFLRQADAFLLSSRCEGFGNVIVEAMGCGTPVISTRCAHGPGEILGNGQYGVLVEPRDPEAFAAAMDDVATLRQRFPSEVLRRRANDFSYTACADRYMDLFKVLAPHRAWVA